MDTTISRMLKLIGVLLVSGFVLDGIRCAQVGDWGNTLGFMWGGLGAGVIFTLIGTIAKYKITDLLGKNRKRSEITTDSIVGMSTAVLAVFAAIGFVAGGLSAAWAKQWDYAHLLLWSGNACGAVLTIIWCYSEQKFVRNMSNKK